MSDELESKLRAALRPVAPTQELTRKLMAQVAAEPALPAPPQVAAEPVPQSAQLASERPVPPRRFRFAVRRTAVWWVPASMAASVLVVLSLQYHALESRERIRESRELAAGLEARREVVEALRMTREKLNLAYETVKGQDSAPADEKTGV